MIEVKHLTKIYGELRAVDDVSFETADGEVLGLLGPNGAGKTTLLNMITGYTVPTSGDVFIDGVSVTDAPYTSRASLGYLPENPPVYRDMTVGEYLRYAAELKKIPRAEIAAETERAAELSGITHQWKRLIRNLSKGYRQRTGFAQALLGRPKTIVLDEPTSGMDPGEIVEIRSLIREIGKESAVILSSHILPEVSEVCGKVVIISEGRVAAFGSTGDILEKYRETSLEDVFLALTGGRDVPSAREKLSEKADDSSL